MTDLSKVNMLELLAILPNIQILTTVEEEE